MQKEFVSVPTAPSVDGYSSSGAPLVIKGFKQSIRCHAPRAIFASLPVLASAPREMIAAGFGDVLGKITALADWELSQLLVGNSFDREIAEANLEAYRSVVQSAPAIAGRDPEAIRVLFEALTYTGESIRRFGSSEPASGSEHFISHFIEMHHLVDGKPALLHGAKVALSTIVSAGWYKMLRGFTKEQIGKLPIEVPDYEADAREIRQLLGEPGDLILESNSFLSTLSQQQVVGIRSLLLDHWDGVQRIAQKVPDPEELKQLLRTVGGPEAPMDLGLTDGELEQAARLSHYVRSRFTISTLFFTLGIAPFPQTRVTP
jgi:glycerol-1-phosphate dehydrogenase [NAD(P)+]